MIIGLTKIFKFTLLWAVPLVVWLLLPFVVVLGNINFLPIFGQLWFVVVWPLMFWMPAVWFVSIWMQRGVSVKEKLLELIIFLAAASVLYYLAAFILFLSAFGGPETWDVTSCPLSNDRYYIGSFATWNDDGCRDERGYRLFREHGLLLEPVSPSKLYNNFPILCGTKDQYSPTTAVEFLDHASTKYTYYPALNLLNCH